jgi:spermidine/putrescine transport system ATP-binding protein
MITEPRILLLDEPIGALDYSLRETVMLELKLLQQRTGISFIWVTHDQNEAFSLGDLVVVMNHARIEQQGTARRSCSGRRPPLSRASSRATMSSAARVLRAADAADGRDRRPARCLVPRSRAPGRRRLFSVRAELITDRPADGISTASRALHRGRVFRRRCAATSSSVPTARF